MPTINVDKQDIFEYLGNTFTTDTFRELCFEFGVELEEDTSEDGTLAPGERAELKIDIPANRYDLVCYEGITRALNIYLGRESTPNYRVVPGAKLQRITVLEDCARIRPYVVGAILRNVTLTEKRYKSFIDLQDKLHSNLCRMRKLVSIGTHDLDTVEGPFTYEARKPEDIKFVPLDQTEQMDGHRVIEFYQSKDHIKKFLDIIRDSPVFPVVYDSKKTVMSLPPLINGDHSKITLDTKNIFIEITATDLTKANVALNIILTMFSVYCAEPFTVEPLEVVYPDGTTYQYPQFEEQLVKTNTKYLNSIIGIDIERSDIVSLLKKMSLEVVDEEKPAHGVTKLLQSMSLGNRASEDQEGEITVKLPPTRPDILHACDVAEDLAVAYGYNKIPCLQKNEVTVGQRLPLNKLSDLVRKEMAMAGWNEALTFSLCSHDENYKLLRRVDDGTEAVVLENPKTREYQVCRTTMLPGLLKSLRENKKYPIPFKIFEVSDVVVKNPERERGAQNIRHACALFSSQMAQFEVIQGLLDCIMQALAVPHTKAGSNTAGYYLVEANAPTYLSGRNANVMYVSGAGAEPINLGTIGVIHPEVLVNFELNYPVSAFEINIEPFL
ncbi:phenylalanine--tRNA ligase subunit beta [Coemansia sp. Benny D115]|nr:phenylalanine--tRNA ligase subunit beta [Coemansia sp. Benny D115]